MGWTGFIEAVWHQVGYAQVGLAALTFTVTLIGAAYTFLTHDYHNEPKTLSGFLRFCLPARILKSQQTRLDIVYVLLKKPLRFLWAWGFVGNVAFAYSFYSLLNQLWPTEVTDAIASPPRVPSAFEAILFFTTVVVLQDLLGFIAHFLLHKIPALWKFHSVHHSALTLIPVTNHRFHPVQEIWDALWNSWGIGLWIALFAKITSLPLADITIFGINANILANCFSFHHLRHSHIYMRYPQWIERVFMSPAQHQIHHSREERHLDRNFGLFLSCWDRLFETIVYSEATPATALGLTESQQGYMTVWGLFSTPFLEFGRDLLAKQAAVAAVAALVLWLLLANGVRLVVDVL
jgi:sterol desaturase/sphingolipid hydroxylase (fatty acid hydroxylase superfamily)